MCRAEFSAGKGAESSFFPIKSAFLAYQPPITGIAGCCPCAASGHVAAAPPSSDMNSRLFNGNISRAFQPERYHTS
jgi:hypothetical protein